MTQTDVLSIADAINVTIQGNKLINRSPGQNNNGQQHNDVIQFYQSGRGGSIPPSGWVIRYNWIELNMTSAFRTGDNSWGQWESQDNSAGFAMKIYGNVFVGDGSTFSGNNGMGADSHGGTNTNFMYNNTLIRANGPDRTIGWISGGTLNMRNNVGMGTVGQGSTDVDVDAMTPGAGGYDYNFWYQFDGTVTAGTTGAHGSTTTDPLFTNFAGNDFSLALGSPLRNAGDSTIGVEYNQGIAPGATWPNPSLVTRTARAWDVGAFQPGPVPPVLPDQLLRAG